MINKILRRLTYEYRKRDYKKQKLLIDNKYNNKDILQSEINEYKLLILPKTSIGKQILVNNSFEKEDTQYLKSIIKSDWNIVDIGANIGYYTMLFAKYAKNGNIYAIEPIDYHGNMIKLSAWMNGFNNIHLYPNIVSDKEKEFDFCISEDGAFSSILDTNRVKIERKVKVKSLVLDRFIDEIKKDIDFLKIDAEGAEKLILNGAIESLRNGKIKRVMIEMYDLNFKPYNTSCEEIDSIFKSFGYESYFIENNKKIDYSSQFANRSLNVFYKIRGIS